MEADNSFTWEVNAANLRITEAKIILLPVSKLNTHPDNRPLGASEEKIRQLRSFIAEAGFDSSHPLVVRPHQNGFQIIEGEHRFRAAKSLGYLQLPCVVREIGDTEALIQLVLGNVQTETKPLEIGLNALKVVQREGKKYTVAEYAKRLVMSDTTVRRYMNASEVYQFVKAQLPEGAALLDEVYKLEEIHRCPQADWLWLHDLVVRNELSKTLVGEITQAIRDIKTDNAAVYDLFDLLKIRQEIAEAFLKGNKGLSDTYQDLIRTTESSYAQLDETISVYEYNVLNDAIDSEQIPLQEWFITRLKELKSLNKNAILEVYKDAISLKRSGTLEEAERTAAYFRDKKNSKEREEQTRLERQMRVVRPGEWWQLGNHRLYCGKGDSLEFRRGLPERIALAYLNMSQINEDSITAWDYIGGIAQTVAVSCEPAQIQTFLRHTHLPFQWILSAHLQPFAGGLGGWQPTLIFAARAPVAALRDTWHITASDLTGKRNEEYLGHLVDELSRPHDIVLDAYAGLGAMFLLAEATHRSCYGAEANPDWCKDLIERWEAQSGAVAKRLG